MSRQSLNKLSRSGRTGLGMSCIFCTTVPYEEGPYEKTYEKNRRSHASRNSSGCALSERQAQLRPACHN
jgi:hypothetical protein